MKKVVILLMSIIFVQVLNAQKAQVATESRMASPHVHAGTVYKNPDRYIAQLAPKVHLQGEVPTVPPQEGKTETERVWVSRGVWIAVILIFIIAYLRWKKSRQ